MSELLKNYIDRGPLQVALYSETIHHDRHQIYLGQWKSSSHTQQDCSGLFAVHNGLRIVVNDGITKPYKGDEASWDVFIKSRGYKNSISENPLGYLEHLNEAVQNEIGTTSLTVELKATENPDEFDLTAVGVGDGKILKISPDGRVEELNFDTSMNAVMANYLYQYFNDPQFEIEKSEEEYIRKIIIGFEFLCGDDKEEVISDPKKIKAKLDNDLEPFKSGRSKLAFSLGGLGYERTYFDNKVDSIPSIFNRTISADVLTKKYKVQTGDVIVVHTDGVVSDDLTSMISKHDMFGNNPNVTGFYNELRGKSLQKTGDDGTIAIVRI